MDGVTETSGGEKSLVLTEEEAVELIALMLSSARGLFDEPADYGPMRLVTITQDLVGKIAPRVTGETRSFLDQLAEGISTYLPRRRADPAGWLKFVDEANRWVARELMRREGMSTGR